MTQLDDMPIDLEKVFHSMVLCECGNKLKVKRIVTTDTDICFYTTCGNENCTLFQEDIGVKMRVHYSEYDLREDNIG